jgi:Na+/proline symporter
MLLSVGVTIYIVCRSLNWSFTGMLSNILKSDYSTIIITDWTKPNFYLKQFLSGMFITIAMTGLDQDMMQKNLTCRNLRDAQKNMFSFGWILVVINFMFMMLGALLFFYADADSIATQPSDGLFANVSVNYLGAFAGTVFLVGLIAAAWSSADGALTALTTSFCIDIIGLDRRDALSAKQKRNIRYAVHFAVALLFLLIIIQFKQYYNKAIIDQFFTIAGYTYGPLLGLYSFGLFTRLQVRDRAVPIIAIASPVISYLLDSNSVRWFNGYEFGFELLIVNGLITFAGLWLCRKKG